MSSKDLHRQLADFIESRRAMPFAWGTNDCALFAADWRVARLGIDPAQNLRGRYTTALGAIRFARSFWGIGEADDPYGVFMWPAWAGYPAVGPSFVQRGDIVAIAGESSRGRKMYALGVCLGTRVAHPGPAGLLFAPAAAIVRAWRPPAHPAG